MTEYTATSADVGTADLDEDGAGRIAVGVDGSPNARQALAWAAQEADRRAARLTVVHAVHLPEPLAPYDYARHRRAEGARLLEQEIAHVRALHPRLTADMLLSEAPAAHALTALSRECDLLVVGARGRGGFAGMLVGSLPRTLAAHTWCPLVAVRDAPAAPGRDEVVLGVGPRHAPEVIRHAFRAARRYGALLTAVRAWRTAPTNTGIAVPSGGAADELAGFRAAALTDVENAIAAAHAEFPDVKVRIKLREGNAVAVALDAAAGARLLVVGAHRHRGPVPAGAGYVVDGVLAHCPTAVAVVPVR